MIQKLGVMIIGFFCIGSMHGMKQISLLYTRTKLPNSLAYYGDFMRFIKIDLRRTINPDGTASLRNPRNNALVALKAYQQQQFILAFLESLQDDDDSDGDGSK